MELVSCYGLGMAVNDQQEEGEDEDKLKICFLFSLATIGDTAIKEQVFKSKPVGEEAVCGWWS